MLQKTRAYKQTNPSKDCILRLRPFVVLSVGAGSECWMSTCWRKTSQNWWSQWGWQDTEQNGKQQKSLLGQAIYW